MTYSAVSDFNNAGKIIKESKRVTSPFTPKIIEGAPSFISYEVTNKTKIC